MAKNVEPSNSNINTNNNTNNVNVKVDVHHPKKTSAKKKPNWLLKVIVGGTVTIIVALIIHYNTDSNQTHNPSGADDKSNAISGIKQ